MKTTKYQKGKIQCYKKPMYSGAMSREFIVTSLIPRIKENDALNLPREGGGGEGVQRCELVRTVVANKAAN